MRPKRNRPSRPLPARLPPAAPALPPPIIYARHPSRLSAGHTVGPLRTHDGLMGELERAIDRAQLFVHVEMYAFASDAAGYRVAGALARARRRGVVVRLIYDVVGAASLQAGVLDYLEHHGVDVRAFRASRRLVHWRQARRRHYPWSPLFNRRNHRKLLVIDGHIAFCSGSNIGDAYDARRPEGEPWLDYGVWLTGPVVASINRLFAHTWRSRREDDRSSELHLPPPLAPRRFRRAHMSRPPAGPRGGAFVALQAIGDGLPRSAIVRAYEHAISMSRRTVYMWNAYFLPGRRLRVAMRAAVRRGVDVCVIVPARSDVPLVAFAMSQSYGGLLRHGIKLFAWQGTMMHAKAAVVDGRWVTVGSANLDPRSRFHNAEANVDIADPSVGGRFDGYFREDLARCRPITMLDWKARPWWHRPVEWFASLFRYWL